jgi:hypothetical protein
MTPSQLAEMHSLADFPVPSRIKHLFDKTPAAAESAANADGVTVTTGDGTDTTAAVRRTIHTKYFNSFLKATKSSNFLLKYLMLIFTAIFMKRSPVVDKIPSEN